MMPDVLSEREGVVIAKFDKALHDRSAFFLRLRTD